MLARLDIGRQFTRTTAFRLLTFLTLVLTPIGIIAVVQTQNLNRELREQAAETHLNRVLTSVDEQRRAIDQAIGSAEVLGALATAGDFDLSSCTDGYQTLIDARENLIFGGLMARDGTTRCNSVGEKLRLAEADDIRILLEQPETWASATVSADDSYGVLTIGTPVGGTRDRPEFFSVLSVAQRALVPRDGDGEDLFSEASANLLFNHSGDLLSSRFGREALKSRLPANRSLAALASDEPIIFNATTEAGDARVFVVVPLYAGTLYALSSWPKEFVLADLDQGVPVWLFPILMWITTLGVAYVSVNRLVLQHTHRLGVRMRRFAMNRRMPDMAPDPNQPAEFTEMDRNFRNMAEAILRDEAELEDAVREKSVLLREVHHRVKNNLQLIASIMNMQIRKSRTSETSAVVKRLQDRVLSLAAVHQRIYQAETLSRVNVAELLNDIMQQTFYLGLPGGADVEVEAEFAPLKMHPDQAVPLALLLAEASTNALKYMGRDADGNARVVARLSQNKGEDAIFIFENSKGERLQPALDTGDAMTLGSQLINAFCRQLSGNLEIENTDDHYGLRVTFPVATYEVELSDT